MSNKNPDFPLYCSFCAKSQTEVFKLIAGPSAFICNECVELCTDLLNEDITASWVKQGAPEDFGELFYWAA